MSASSAPPTLALNHQVAQALAHSEHLRIDARRLEYLPEHLPMLGGFGTVKVAKLDDQKVAVKELRIAGSLEYRARFLMRFARELKVWALLDHPNLLKLSGFNMDVDASIAQFISPFYHHGHISNYIEAHSPGQDTRLRLAEDTALGLRYLHELHIVHGDLKDLNVLVDPEPRALLCDYGLSKIVDPDGNASGLTTTGIPMSVRFASPEIVDGSEKDLASDVWAWGCLFLLIFTGISPYDGIADVACVLRISRAMPPADTSTLTISVELKNMLERCWNQQPSRRPSVSRCIDFIKSARAQQHSIQINKEHLWDALFNEPKMILKGHNNTAHSLAFLRGSSLLASASEDATVRMWDVESGATVATLDCETSVFTVASAPSGTRVASGMLSGEIRIWDTLLGEEGMSTGGHTSWRETSRLYTNATTYSVLFSPEGSHVAAGLGNSTVLLWDGLSSAPIFDSKGHKNAILRVNFSADGKWLASCYRDRMVRVWNVAAALSQGTASELSKEVTLEGHTDTVNSIAFSPDGRWLASASDDKTIRVWDVASWERVATLRSGERCFMSVSFSPDSKRLVCGTFKGEVQLWNMTSWRLIITLEGHGDSVNVVAFSPDGTRIASGSSDTTVRIWDATFTAVSDAPDIPTVQLSRPRSGFQEDDWVNVAGFSSLSSSGSLLAVSGILEPA